MTYNNSYCVTISDPILQNESEVAIWRIAQSAKNGRKLLIPRF